MNVIIEACANDSDRTKERVINLRGDKDRLPLRGNVRSAKVENL